MASNDVLAPVFSALDALEQETIVPDGSAPVIDLSGTPVTFVEDGPAVQLDADIDIADADRA